MCQNSKGVLTVDMTAVRTQRSTGAPHDRLPLFATRPGAVYDLRELGDKIGSSGLWITDLTQGEGNDDCHEHISERVVEISVHWVASPSLQKVQ